MAANDLQLEVYYGQRPPWPNSALLFTENSALVVDAQFQRTDAKAVAERILESGKPLEAILISHSHPDHVWGGVELLRHFPDAKAYARPLIAKEIDLEFRARQLRWTEIFNVGPFKDEIPRDLFAVTPLEGDHYDFDGHRIDIIDTLPHETINATAYYVPEMKTYIAGDQLYNKCHFYVGAGLNRPDLWMKSIQEVTASLDIERVVPGHGYVGGMEIFEDAIEYLRFYESVAKPFVPAIQIVHKMLDRYPGLGLEGVLYMTIGPGMTDQALIEETKGHVSFGSGPIAEGYYKGE